MLRTNCITTLGCRSQKSRNTQTKKLRLLWSNTKHSIRVERYLRGSNVAHCIILKGMLETNLDVVKSARFQKLQRGKYSEMSTRIPKSLPKLLLLKGPLLGFMLERLLWRLHQARLWGHRSRKTALLTAIKARQKFALGDEIWKSVLWSDETKLEVFGNMDAAFLCWRKGEAFNPSHSGGGSIMLWGSFAASKTGKFVWVREFDLVDVF